MKELYEKIKKMEYPTDADVIEAVKEYGGNTLVNEVVEKAFNAWNESGDGTCEITEEGNLESHFYSGSSYNDDTNIELYRFKANWVSQNSWDHHNSLVTDEEWDEIKKEFGDEADFTDENQLDSIGVDLNERLLEYVQYNLI